MLRNAAVYAREKVLDTLARLLDWSDAYYCFFEDVNRWLDHKLFVVRLVLWVVCAMVVGLLMEMVSTGFVYVSDGAIGTKILGGVLMVVFVLPMMAAIMQAMRLLMSMVIYARPRWRDFPRIN